MSVIAHISWASISTIVPVMDTCVKPHGARAVTLMVECANHAGDQGITPWPQPDEHVRVGSWMGAANNCLFCRIAAGEAEASVLYSDEFVSAFMDLFPVVPGHLLVIPNTHAESLGVLEEALSAQVFSLGRHLGEALRRSPLSAEAIGYYLADGSVAGQVVPHVHLHVIPRFSGDGAVFPLHSKAPVKAERDQLDSQASGIRAALHDPSI